MLTKEETGRALRCAIRRNKVFPEIWYETWMKALRAEVDELSVASTFQSKHISEFTEREEELADVVITCMSMAAFYGIELGKVIEAKMKYNEERED